MIYRERCPVIKCDYFEHKQKNKTYRITGRYRKKYKLLERLEAIEVKLDELARSVGLQKMDSNCAK